MTLTGPAQAPVAEMRASFYVLSGFARWVLIALSAALLFECLYLISAVGDYWHLSQLGPNYYGDLFETAPPLLLVFRNVALWGYTAVIWLCYVLSGIWIYRAASNARLASGQAESISPGWAVGWYFIPIMSFWKPYQAMKSIWQFTFAPNGQAPGFFPYWWGAWIMSNLLVQASKRTWNSASDIEGFMGAYIFDFINFPIALASIWLFRRVVREITAGQADWGRHGPLAKVFE